jgi:hypothetical protein
MIRQPGLPGIAPTRTRGPLTCPRCGLEVPAQPVVGELYHLKCPNRRRPGLAPRLRPKEPNRW